MQTDTAPAAHDRAPPECAGLTFVPVPEFSDVDIAFGASRDAYFDRYALPKVPRKYGAMASRLFFSGGKIPAFAPEIDRTKAARALRAWLTSFAPAHEAKEATVAYALWAWGAHPAAEG